MKITLLVVGGVRGPLRDVIQDYERRVAHYFKFEVIEVAGGAGGRDDPTVVMQAEAERLSGRLPEAAELIVLDRTGRAWSSRDLALHLEERAVHGLGDVALLIGGAWGVHRELRSRAARIFSLGALTLPHELARLIVTEQLYRAGTILRNEPYHKGRD